MLKIIVKKAPSTSWEDVEGETFPDDRMGKLRANGRMLKLKVKHKNYVYFIVKG